MSGDLQGHGTFAAKNVHFGKPGNVPPGVCLRVEGDDEQRWLGARRAISLHVLARNLEAIATLLGMAHEQ